MKKPVADLLNRDSVAQECVLPAGRQAQRKFDSSNKDGIIKNKKV
jgi:hypothetical protein